MKLVPLRYAWRKSGDRFDLVLMGNPDCHAYIVRYKGANDTYGSAWCWTLTMPRADGDRWTNWAHSAPIAKRQVESVIQENWV